MCKFYKKKKITIEKSVSAKNLNGDGFLIITQPCILKKSFYKKQNLLLSNLKMFLALKSVPEIGKSMLRCLKWILLYVIPFLFLGYFMG